ncbi:thiol reductant ABC exporter subunit CydC [Pengzhenrongella frigida]|uniref:Thiol reductant ABC exporter subunit CydC n=1 Tax=Pengzhenrongella frigida TaxID=1259133 RepID=A0A4Q5N3A2_9MICO|nr:thiol reductant ABC exporter subunit CydC [Cellulomonas sp. HLT2-17]RYV52698.1 thiol reductant ABC exporter subunit CydC [Cellulomonas sp. HLT2-17]
MSAPTRAPAHPSEAPTTTDPLARGLVPQEERSALRRSIRLLHIDRRRLLWAVLAGSAGLGSAVALTATAAWMIARASQMPDFGQLAVAAVAVRLFGTSRAVLRYLERLASHQVALEGMAALRESVYTTLASGRTDTVTTLRRGDLLARTGADVDSVGDVVVRALVPAAVAALVGLGSAVLVGWLNVGAGIVLAGCLLVAGVVGPALTIRSVRLSEHAQILARSELSATAMTMVDGAGELTVSGGVHGMLSELRRTEVALARAKDAGARPAALAAGIDTLAMGVAVLGSLLLGVPATIAGAMQPVELAVIVLTPLAAFEGTALLGPAAAQLVRSGGAALRIMRLLDNATSDRTTSGSAADGSAPTAQLSAVGVSVGWPGGPIVAHGIDLDVAPGRAIAVVGASGLGKTTVLLTLAGLLPPVSGQVTVGGRAAWGAPRPWVSRQVVLTAEDAHIFATTVLENLRVARGDVTPEEATDLLGRVELGPWLAALPQGLDTVLGSDATTISGGERRRLLLARALASRAQLLLLDEPGEHLDASTADRLVADLLRTAHESGAGPAGDEPRGLVLVTHRLAALGGADEVIVLGHAAAGGGPAPDQGGLRRPVTVVARGTHAELLASVPEYRWAAEQDSAPDV